MLLVLLKSFLSNKKIPCIPPLIHNNQFVVDFKEKNELFHSFFVKQCTYNIYNIQRQTLFDKIATIDANILTENENSTVNTLLFGKPNCENSFNKAMLNASIEYILSTERFNIPLV